MIYYEFAILLVDVQFIFYKVRTIIKLNGFLCNSILH